MNTNMNENYGNYEACLEILEREAGLLAQLGPIQEAVTRAVIRREWEGFDSSIHSLAELSGRFEDLEGERARIFAGLSASLPGADGAERFYALVSRFPEPQRQEITGRYRELKRESLKLKAANTDLLDYLDEARTVVGSFLETALPKRFGPAYSRQGTKVPQDMRNMVLNQGVTG
ncbi:hypothetical protein AGMMS49928_04070 [Spirochaetia bacterium]|nr:hypothetical protein AGMMS49928_04070 [Spirochaetia bacterium]